MRVIITGGSRGIGLEIAKRFANGGKIALVDVLEDALAGAKKTLEAMGAEVMTLPADVRDTARALEVVGSVVGAWEGVDVLVNNAGITRDKLLMRMEEEDWDAVLDVNLKGAVYFCHAVLGPMIARKSGVVINMGSVDGVTGSCCLDYGAAKSGMIGLTKSLALYGAPHGIRSCCVSPGPVLTRPEMANMKTRLGRAAEPEEIVKLILYLSSDDAAFVTGANYVIDGGRSIGGMA